MAPSAMPINGDPQSPPALSYGENLGSGREPIPTTSGHTNGISQDSDTPIAIVGMGCRLPGDVSTPDEFWELCSRARSGWSPIPKSRWNHSAFQHPNPDKMGCYNPEGGHFLEEDIGLFDAPFFSITEKEAISMGTLYSLLGYHRSVREGAGFCLVLHPDIC